MSEWILGLFFAHFHADNTSSYEEVPGLYDAVAACNFTANNSVVKPPNDRWFCGLEKGQSMLVHKCYEWLYNDALEHWAERGRRGYICLGNPARGSII
jgi:hypothetical protein